MPFDLSHLSPQERALVALFVGVLETGATAALGVMGYVLSNQNGTVGVAALTAIGTAFGWGCLDGLRQLLAGASAAAAARGDAAGAARDAEIAAVLAAVEAHLHTLPQVTAPTPTPAASTAAPASTPAPTPPPAPPPGSGVATERTPDYSLAGPLPAAPSGVTFQWNGTTLTPSPAEPVTVTTPSSSADPPTLILPRVVAPPSPPVAGA